MLWPARSEGARSPISNNEQLLVVGIDDAEQPRAAVVALKEITLESTAIVCGCESRQSTMGDWQLGHEHAVVCVATFFASRLADIARGPPTAIDASGGDLDRGLKRLR